MVIKENPSHIDFHLVIPCFEESKRVPSYLDALATQLKDQKFCCNILIVDDGSSKEERRNLQKIITNQQQRHPEILNPLFLDRNYGKGYAVRAGWESDSTAKWLAFVDADGSTPPHEVVRVFDFIYGRNDQTRCYFGSRIRMLGRTVERDWKRHVMGRLYTTLVGWIINESVYDPQCGFKIISRKAFDLIRTVLEENRFAFDCELIAALVDAGLNLEEIPIDWRDIPGTKISILFDSSCMVRSLFVIKNRRRRWTLSSIPK